MTSALHLLGMSLEVFLLDLLLSGDNAVVIALACRRLPAAERQQVLVAGTGIAVVLRVVLSLLASLVLLLPALKLAGGIALAVIAVRLMLDEGDDGSGPSREDHAATVPDAGAALRTVVIADLIMSMDNVMALAGLAHGQVGVLALGTVFSVPLLMFGSWFVTRILANYPLLVPLGGALLGWVAGSIAMSDPLFATWVTTQSPLLQVVVPALTAAYVVLQTRIVRERSASAAKLRPLPLPRPVRAEAAAPASFAAAAAPAAPATAPAVLPAVAAPVPVRAEVAVSPAPSVEPEARPSSAPRVPHWVVAGGIAAVVALLGGLIYLAQLPAPAALKSYDCAGSGFVVGYTMGGAHIRVTSGTTVVEGTVDAGNRITWGQPQPAGATLGVPLPDMIRFADATTLGLAGDSGPGITCKLR